MTDNFKYCSNCGTQVPLSANFCSKCGYIKYNLLFPNIDANKCIENPTSHLLPDGQYKPTEVQYAINIPQNQPPDNKVAVSKSDYVEFLRLTLKSRNCGCVRGIGARNEKLCNLPCNLWCSVHFWSLFFMIQIECYAGYLIYLQIDYTFYIPVIVYGIIPCIAQICAVRYCIPSLMYIIRTAVWIELIVCVFMFIGLIFGIAMSDFKTMEWLLLWYGIVVIQYILLIWMDNVFLCTHTLANYFKDNGEYPTNANIRDFDPKYRCCFVDPCVCCCLSWGFLCIGCCAKIGANADGHDDARGLTQIALNCC